MAGFGAKTTGLNEVDKMFRVLPKRVKNKIITKALRFGAKEIVKRAKANVPSGVVITFADGKEFRSEQLKKIKVLIKGKPGNKYAIIGPDADAGFFNFGNWIEFGTLAKRTKALKKPRGSVAQSLASKGVGLVKHPFMRPAVDGSRSIVANRMEDKIGTEIVKEVDRILKRGKV